MSSSTLGFGQYKKVAFSRDYQVICGNEFTSWESYFAAAKFLIYKVFIDELNPQAWKNYVSIVIREDMRKALLHELPEYRDEDATNALLASGLTQVRHRQATNAKDKIYRLYAAFAAIGIALPAPDCGKSLERIYEEACLAIMLHSRFLQMLEYASSNARSPNLPTWVADWQDEDVTLVNPPVADATEGSRISRTQLSALSPASGQLHVRSCILGTIESRSETAFATLDFPPASLPILQGKEYEFAGLEVDALRLLIRRIRLFCERMHLIDEVIALPQNASHPAEAG